MGPVSQVHSAGAAIPFVPSLTDDRPMKQNSNHKDSRPPPEGCVRGIGSVIHGVWMSSPKRGQANLRAVTVSPETRASHPYPRDGANQIWGMIF